MSRTPLYNKLKALTGMESNDYITKIRLEQATQLLLTTNLKINYIADRTDFSTSRYFSTLFKQNMVSSPTQYKEKQEDIAIALYKASNTSSTPTD